MTSDQVEAQPVSNRSQPTLAAGSQWRRWDPHLHAPGTVLNDQFEGDWDGYLAAVAAASPTVEVLGVTDYYSIACYQEVRRHHQAGRLPGVKLLFPNVEMRLDLATERKQAVNLHLLFCPDDPDHEREIQRVLAALTFEFRGRAYRCTPDDLALLGRAHNPAVSTEHKARSAGANQFKVTVGQVRDLFRADAWAVRNCLVAVSGGTNDGTSGLKKDSGFDAWRTEVERLTHVVFSSTPSVREFWLGRKAGFGVEVLEREYGGRKPCLHGSDAHCVTKAATPDGGRLCWIKGDPSFESLRQALLEPEERVWVGAAPPGRHDAGMCVREVTTQGTAWLSNATIPLNPGLVAIIGARGSGKTALADLIAAGADVASPYALDSSFLCRASRPVNYLKSAVVTILWGDGRRSVKRLCSEDGEPAAAADGEGVRYLSQQFVEQLCSAEGLAVELRREIERVIFEATEPTDRLDADSFDQLAEIYLGPIRYRRRAIQDAIGRTSSQVVAEDLLLGRLEALGKERDALAGRIEKTAAEMRELLPKDQGERARRLGDLEAALAAATVLVDKQKRARLRVEDLKKEIDRLRATTIPNLLSRLKADYQDAGLVADEWQAISLQFSDSADGVLVRRATAIDGVIRRMTEGDPTRPGPQPTTPLTDWPLNALRAERDRVKAEVGIDAQRQNRYDGLRRGLERDERSHQRVAAELDHARGAGDRKQRLIESRRQLYEQVFETYVEEQQVLMRLYGPLQALMEKAEGSLSRLRFSVTREIDLAGWVEAGERLLDLRKESKLRGHGALRREAERLLAGTWKIGTPSMVAGAMQLFIQELLPEIRRSMPGTVPQGKESEWWQQVAGWVYGTDHVRLAYSITYDDVAIEHLSPGTRGIVLLLLYLVIDKHDQRPLVIDQPEENLDPKSIFDELVPHFREARRRRQVIIVTHNANLVVNTDADQVIVASSARKAGTGLPQLNYTSGSLEDPAIRAAVCGILEGGERAFRDRERRYRLHWDAPR